MPGALSVPGLGSWPSSAGSQGSRSSCALELMVGCGHGSTQPHHTSPCALESAASRLHPHRASFLHSPGLSPGSLVPLPLQCFVLHPDAFHATDLSGLGFRSLSLLWVPLANTSALDPFHPVSLHHPLARSPHLPSTLAQTLTPGQQIHRSTVQSCSDTSISPADPLAPSSLALAIVPSLWFRMLGWEQVLCELDL